MVNSSDICGMIGSGSGTAALSGRLLDTSNVSGIRVHSHAGAEQNNIAMIQPAYEPVNVIENHYSSMKDIF